MNDVIVDNPSDDDDDDVLNSYRCTGHSGPLSADGVASHVCHSKTSFSLFVSKSRSAHGSGKCVINKKET